ncbi:MAG: flagellar biosynthesis anti-sigma factor FlgM [Proteobacteria bacterium]|nr:flagellar biosynthesis anti-sigma factor FlgM [Pseudomonadota bacterium]MBU1582621.1 flagellar biosynthesis anti-sigma factor FlgM [Pseudomonadota bacterium]MBU2453571.1 flagellar biosynthesis anti-sigma factor FlgM [Pseudomonadota bacterium]MBU2630331.1 flagellar biosynthesis anti-sigma factor FlgM [Pseudomonadota bacterium]
MKISNSTPNYINQTYANQANTAASQNVKSQKTADEAANETLTDSINFSGRTKDLQKISKAMETEPADRQKYVADIKQKVETNQYNINAETVAEKMVGSLMNEIG